MPQNQKDRPEITEEPRTDEQDEQDVEFEAEELEERIAPGMGIPGTESLN
jgi:hypothetical protein